MVQSKKILAASLFAAASLVGSQSSSQAVVFAEVGDAGSTLATASGTGPVAGVSLTAITGSFSGLNDADLFKITITAPSTFSASTVNALTNTGGQDTALFLFSATGTAIATNDDAPGGLSVDSSLPSGNSLFASLAAGTYYLGISESGNEAVNSVNQLLFAGYPGGDTTAVRGAAGSVNPTTLFGFNSNSFGGGAGSYQIDLTSTATATVVPEPSTWAALALGSLAAGAMVLRRRSSRA